MPVTVGSDRELAGSFRSKNPFKAPPHGAVALYDDDLEIEEVDYDLAHSTATSEFTGAVSQFSQIIERPGYDLYYNARGGETRFLRNLRAQVDNTVEDWRDVHVETEIAKHNMKFAETARERRDARAKFEMLYMWQEMLRLNKWRAEANLKEHRETAKRLKVRHKRDVEEQKSWEKIQKLQAARKRRRSAFRPTLVRRARRLL